jgi:alcohol dehydrogenase (cytochrome c)
VVAISVIACAACGGAAIKGHATVDWPAWGNVSGNTHYAALAQVNTANVRRLRVAWSAPEGPFQFEWETFPIVVGKTMYYDTDTGQVVAADAATGHVIWEYTPEVDFLASPRGAGTAPISRGVTYGAGRIYELTYDDQLIALDARTGKELWDVRVANAAAGYASNSPGTYWNGEVIIGGPAGDAGLRGYVAAYNARNGHKLWRTYTIPRRGEGWLPAAGAHGGGDVWMMPTVDSRTGTVYVSTGNPFPAFYNGERRGCDPMVDATVALNARTGAVKWFHSEVCEDSWDSDTDQSPLLFHANVGGRTVAAVGDASKSGFYSILNAATGQLIAHSPYITRYSNPHLVPTEGGTVVCPGIYGGIEYGPTSYSASAHSLYLAGNDQCMRFKLNALSEIQKHKPGTDDLEGKTEQVGPATGVIVALNSSTAQIKWRTRLPKPAIGGTLATAGGLVFVGDDDGYLYALDAHTGRKLWRFHLGMRVGSAPIAYQIAGVEYIAIAAGGSQSLAKGEPSPRPGKLFVFSLGR